MKHNHVTVVKTATGYHVETAVSHNHYTTGHLEGLGLKGRRNEGLTEQEANGLAREVDRVLEERESTKRKRK